MSNLTNAVAASATTISTADIAAYLVASNISYLDGNFSGDIIVPSSRWGRNTLDNLVYVASGSYTPIEKFEYSSALSTYLNWKKEIPTIGTVSITWSDISIEGFPIGGVKKVEVRIVPEGTVIKYNPNGGLYLNVVVSTTAKEVSPESVLDKLTILSNSTRRSLAWSGINYLDLMNMEVL